jgi:hypothetical protein
LKAPDGSAINYYDLSMFDPLWNVVEPVHGWLTIPKMDYFPPNAAKNPVHTVKPEPEPESVAPEPVPPSPAPPTRGPLDPDPTEPDERPRPHLELVVPERTALQIARDKRRAFPEYVHDRLPFDPRERF